MVIKRDPALNQGPGGRELSGLQLMDMAPTILQHLEVPIPMDMQGKPFWLAATSGKYLFFLLKSYEGSVLKFRATTTLTRPVAPRLIVGALSRSARRYSYNVRYRLYYLVYRPLRRGQKYALRGD